MESLPNEIFLIILRELNNYELTLIRTVSHKWNHFIVNILEKYSIDINDCLIDGNYYYLTKNYKINSVIFKNDYYASLIDYTDHHFLKKMFTNRTIDIDNCLGISSKFGYLNAVQLLLEKGADLHAGNDYALRWASSNGHFAVVKLLLEKGANLRADNDTALKVARINGHSRIMKLIKTWKKIE